MTARSRLLGLPSEIHVLILQRLHPREILRVKSTCKQLSRVVQNSLYCRYIIACYAAGVVDNPRSQLPLSDRHDLLLQREDAWQSLTPKRIFGVEVPPQFHASGGCDLVDGTFVLGCHPDSGGGGYAYLQMPQTKPNESNESEAPKWRQVLYGDMILNFGISSHEDDLIAIVIW